MLIAGAPIFSNEFVIGVFVVLGLLVIGAIGVLVWIVKLLVKWIENK